ncbi:MAG TPA: serine/threonine-protein kinase [Gaiellaceae bacterium]|nr:serine/threonine-protein kinase [Gaiellaceae bacterium]
MPSIDTQLPPRYREPQLLARGGMADVYRATDEELGRDVAIKVLADRYAEDESLRRRFSREALAAARLSGNPHIVTIFDVAEHDGRPMIVMELVPGGSLEQKLTRGVPRDPGQALDWLEDAAAAIDAAHAAGIVHRDVKPGNLLLDEHGRVKVADFGIASAAGLDSFTRTGTILGTAGYFSPEQARGEQSGPASDRYALGVVAWELLTGRRPFEAQTPAAEAAAHVQAPVPSIAAANRDLPPAYDAIFERALAKDPGARFPTAAEFVGELHRALDEEAGDTWVVPATTLPITPPKRSRLFALIAAVVAAAVAAGIAAAVLATRGGGDPRVLVRTVTRPGTTVERTVTSAPPPPSTTSAATTSAATTSAGSGTELNNAGFAKMQAHDYNGALPLLEQAVERLQGSGSLDEAYADYNLAYTRLALGNCDGVLDLLDNSQRIQGHRKEIDRLRHDAQKSCQGDQ